LLTAQWADHLVTDAKGLDAHTRHKAEFYVRQIVNAISPSNFVLTNPELLRETLTSNAENLARGMHMLAEDIEAGGGELKIRQWCGDQGLTVFVISWVNPDQRLAQKSFEDYMREGPLQALDVIAEVTGEDKVHAIGYCVGGTLLSITLAYMAAKGDERIMSAT